MSGPQKRRAADAVQKAKANDTNMLGESLTSIDWLTRVRVNASDRDAKPTESYATLIARAIRSVKGEPKRMTLAEIYEWLLKEYPYFKTAGDGWKNSVRHNLSLNKAFKKVQRDPKDHGKGSYWMLQDDMEDVEEIPPPKRSKKRRKKKESEDSPGTRPTRASIMDAATMDALLASPQDSVPLGNPAAATGSGNVSLSLAFDPTSLDAEASVLLQDLTSSFKKMADSFKNPSTKESPLSLEHFETLLNNVESSPSLAQSLNRDELRRAQSLMASIKADKTTAGNWMSSSLFPSLAQSFNNLVGSTGLLQEPLSNAADLDDDDEDEFDWSKIT